MNVSTALKAMHALMIGLASLAVISCGGSSSSSDPAPAAATTTTSTSTDTSTSSTTVSKSATQLTVAGTLSLSSSLSLTKGAQLLAAPTSLKCVDAVDGTEYATGVAVGADGSFSCPNVPQCYDATSCAKATPVQVNIIDETSGNTICVATSGSSGLVCDTAGCFAAAQAALDDNAKACLTSVNMVAASNVFQDALNKAFKMGEIALDKYSLESCLAMNASQKLEALSSLTKGSLAEVLIDSLDSQLKKEIHKCDATAGEAASPASVIRDFVTMGFGILITGTDYDADKAVAGTVGGELSSIHDQIRSIRIEVANGRDPEGLVTAGTVSDDVLKYQLVVNCLYSNEDDDIAVETALNAEKTDFAACPATYTHNRNGQSVTIPLAGKSLGTSLTFPDINDPQGLHNDSRGSSIPLEYVAFKKVINTPDARYSLNDIYDIFFTNTGGLKFRLVAEEWDQSAGQSKSYVIGPDGTAHASGDNMSTYADNSYAPSFTQVYDFLTDEQVPFDLDKLIRIKVHRRWNPTGQEFFYVSGRAVSGKEVPVTCDLVDAAGQPVGLNITTGVQLQCVATSVTADMKRYFVDTSSNHAFLRILSRNNGSEVRSKDNSPVFLQNLNQAPGGSMPTCTSANQVSIYKYEKSGEHDAWLDGKVVRTVCTDFSALKNPAEFFVPHFQEVTIGNNSWSSHVIAGRKSDDSVVPVCVAQSSITVSEVFACVNDSTGAVRACSGDSSTCSCDWQNGESMREYAALGSTPADGSLALTECSSSSYYLSYHWEPGARSSLGALKVQLISGSSGQYLEQRNTAWDPNVVNTHITSAFSACKDSQWCWRRDDIASIAAHTDIPAENSWWKSDIVSFYCHENSDNATIKADCDKLKDYKPLTITFASFSNASNSTGANVFEVYNNDSYFSHLQQPNPNYNKVFDFDTYTFVYDNYDPFCDDVNGDGRCSFTAGSTTNDVFFSDIWNFRPDFVKYSPVDGLAGFTYDSNNTLFPAAPSSFDQNTWQTYVNPVFDKIGGPAALACSNDRTLKLSWNDMNFWEDNLWTSAREETCGSASGYFVVRDIVPNKNTYLVSQPDRIQTLMRMAFGTLDKQSVDPAEKRFDFVQAMSVFMISMEVPPMVIGTDGSYSPLTPTINGRELRDGWAGYQPLLFDGSLVGLIDLFISKGATP